MLPSVVVGIVFMLIAALASATLGQRAYATATRQALQEQAQVAVAQAATRYTLETGQVPTSLAQLAGTLGYEDVRQYTQGAPLVSLTASNALTDPFIGEMADYFPTYRRAVVVVALDRTITPAEFLNASNNKCAGVPAVGFSTSPSWCGDSTLGRWSVVSERAALGPHETQASRLQQATVDKFVARYTALVGASPTLAFPVAASPITLTSVAVPTLGTASVVGSSAQTCTGTFTWPAAPLTTQGIPLDCADLYNYFGQPVRYQRTSVSRMVLTSNSRHFASDGVTFKVITTASS